MGCQAAGRISALHRVYLSMAQVAHIVRVLTDNRDQRLWLAAAPPDEAINQVLDAVPEGWAAALLSNYVLSLSEVAALHLCPGGVREITSKAN